MLICLSDSAKPTGPSRALKLGSKKKDVDTFVGQIQLEGESKRLDLSLSLSLSRSLNLSHHGLVE